MSRGIAVNVEQSCARPSDSFRGLLSRIGYPGKLSHMIDVGNLIDVIENDPEYDVGTKKNTLDLAIEIIGYPGNG